MNDATRPSPRPPVDPRARDRQWVLDVGRPRRAFALANWDAGPGRIRSPQVFKPELDAALRNVKDVVVHMCFTREFCSNSGAASGRGTTSYGTSSG